MQESEASSSHADAPVSMSQRLSEPPFGSTLSAMQSLWNKSPVLSMREATARRIQTSSLSSMHLETPVPLAFHMVFERCMTARWLPQADSSSGATPSIIETGFNTS